MKYFSKMIMVIIVIAVAIGTIQSANAVPTLWLSLDDPFDANAPIVVSAPLVGGVAFVAYIGPVGPSWTANITGGITGTAFVTFMDLSSQNTNFGGGPATIDIMLSRTGLNYGAPALRVDTSISATVGVLTGPGHNDTLDMYKYYDTNDTEFGLTNLIHNLSFVVPSNQVARSFNGDVTTTVPLFGSDFSVTDHVRIYHGSRGETSSFDSLNQLTPVPEPGTLLLIGAGLAGIAGYSRIKLSRKKRAS